MRRFVRKMTIVAAVMSGAILTGCVELSNILPNLGTNSASATESLPEFAESITSDEYFKQCDERIRGDVRTKVYQNARDKATLGDDSGFERFSKMSRSEYADFAPNSGDWTMMYEYYRDEIITKLAKGSADWKSYREGVYKNCLRAYKNNRTIFAW